MNTKKLRNPFLMEIVGNSRIYSLACPELNPLNEDLSGDFHHYV